jgi:hypothetical protein
MHKTAEIVYKVYTQFLNNDILRSTLKRTERWSSLDGAHMIRVFIGSSSRNIVETKVFQHTLKTRTSLPVETIVMNGMTDTLEMENGETVRADLPASVRDANVSTRFTFYRYAIPHFCGYQGRAIYCDSDQLLMKDLRPLWEMDMKENAIMLCKAYSADHWATSVMLIDCSRARFDLAKISSEIAAGSYRFYDMCYLTPVFLEHNPMKLGSIPYYWNALDYCDNQTRIIHFTNLNMQPWRFDFHPYEDLWLQHLTAALRDGAVTIDQINDAVSNGYVKKELPALADTGVRLGFGERIRRHAKAAVSNAKFIGGVRPYIFNLARGMQRV